MEDKKDSPKKCPECKGKVIESTQEVYCCECGLVLEDCPIEFGYDWDFDDIKRRRGGKPGRFIDGDTRCTDPTTM